MRRFQSVRPRPPSQIIDVLSAGVAAVIFLVGGANAAPPESAPSPKPTLTPVLAPTVPPPAAGAVEKATPSANVSRMQAWKDAEMIASLGPGRLEVIGTGDSMRPIYGEATILVISRVNYEDLKTGMSVAYTTKRGTRVVHQLLKKDRLGWRIQGFNNAKEDKERVTKENLIGVVYASLSYDPELK